MPPSAAALAPPDAWEAVLGNVAYTTNVCLTLPPELIRKIDAQAARETRSRSQFVRLALECLMAAQPPPAQQPPPRRERAP